ncbi:hypothetical protein GCM10010377_60660 [Streptomyces viridiviolaceus]|uniref:Regulatory protein n=1 Tax=Streptomyces viridiviolaceus TaxID=68282 RepID=A0ABW2EAM4_9ACTN|nr:hypothetical protein [Streptomyces viridiviolaceus]GHB61571.1 hypothetical protein GCM10010377_60660 [Streptomyces viridiviolaceus]
MAETTATTPGLTSHYTAQVADDLERNTKEQERIGAEIAALQQQLSALQQDHTVLVNLQQALGLAPAPAESAPVPPVPAPRKKEESKAGTGKQARAKKASAPSRKPAAKKSPAKEASARATTDKAAQPTLVDTVRAHLAEQSEPRSAAEIATALGRQHPERDIKTTVVRNTLESLVAKEQAQRSKQGSSVFYTAVTPKSGATAQEKQDQPA